MVEKLALTQLTRLSNLAMLVAVSKGIQAVKRCPQNVPVRDSRFQLIQVHLCSVYETFMY